MSDERVHRFPPLSAAEVPELRARMAAWACDREEGAVNWFAFLLGPRPHQVGECGVFADSDDVGGQIAGTLRAQLPAAELFYVSEHMTELAVHAAHSLTDYRLHPEDLPAPVGLMVYHHPPVPDAVPHGDDDDGEAISLISWGPGRGGVWVNAWNRSDGPEFARRYRRFAETVRRHQDERASDPRKVRVPSELDQALAHPIFRDRLARAPIPLELIPQHGYWWCGLTPMSYTDMTGWPDALGPSEETAFGRDTKILLERTILASWLLMGQTLSSREIVRAPRAARRRLARDTPGLDPTVRYIDLRRIRTTTVGAPPTDGAGRTYRHQWIVRGHWRNQWYPSRGDHRPIWIAPHLAGPEDKPLLGGDRVNILRR